MLPLPEVLPVFSCWTAARVKMLQGMQKSLTLACSGNFLPDGFFQIPRGALPGLGAGRG